MECVIARIILEILQLKKIKISVIPFMRLKEKKLILYKQKWLLYSTKQLKTMKYIFFSTRKYMLKYLSDFHNVNLLYCAI